MDPSEKWKVAEEAGEELTKLRALSVVEDQARELRAREMAELNKALLRQKYGKTAASSSSSSSAAAAEPLGEEKGAAVGAAERSKTLLKQKYATLPVDRPPESTEARASPGPPDRMAAAAAALAALHARRESIPQPRTMPTPLPPSVRHTQSFSLSGPAPPLPPGIGSGTSPPPASPTSPQAKK
jgi:hypothetical protein